MHPKILKRSRIISNKKSNAFRELFLKKSFDYNMPDYPFAQNVTVQTQILGSKIYKIVINVGIISISY